VTLCEQSERYGPEDPNIARLGAGEDQPLEFLSPYGCSKGSADQYVLDYAHSFGIRATVFRMSCIYGPYQLGSEDQGWVAHFVRQAMKGDAITIYGDGKQVRDLLFVEDLVRAMRLAQDNMEICSGQVFNIGGGVENSTSLLELIAQLRLLVGGSVPVEWGPERLADQHWYVADTSKIREALAWTPNVNIRQGLRALHAWYLDRPTVVERAEAQVA
jgi:CDP-paratose 2-epimerase